MITLDPSRGREPTEQRPITYCDPYNGLLYDIPISALVVLQTMRHLQDLDLDPADPDNVAEHSGEIAEYLVNNGWFTTEEYIADIARDETEDIEDELRKLLG